MSNPNQSFENLTHSGLIRVNSKDSKDVTLSLDVYGGSTSFCVFTGNGGKPYKVPLPPKISSTILRLLTKMRSDVKPNRQPIEISNFNPETKKFEHTASMGIGIDENLVFTIDVSAKELGSRHIFQLKGDSRFDFSKTMLTEKEMLESILDWLITIFSVSIPMAERLTSFKRQPPQGGGNRGGNYNRNNNNNSNNNGGGWGSSLENDLHV